MEKEYWQKELLGLPLAIEELDPFDGIPRFRLVYGNGRFLYSWLVRGADEHKEVLGFVSLVGRN